MAKHIKEQKQVNLWFQNYLQELLQDGETKLSSKSDQFSAKHSEKGNSQPANKNQLFYLIKKHSSFFEDERSLTFLKSLPINKLDDLSELSQSQEKYAGKMVVSGESINFWIDPKLNEQGVNFEAANSHEFEIEDNVDPVHNSYEGSELIPATLNSLKHVKITLNIPDNLVIQNPFIVEYKDLNGDYYFPIHFLINIGKSASVKVVLDNKDNNSSDRKLILFQLTELNLDENAELFFYKNQNANHSMAIFTHETITQKRDSHAEIFDWENGGLLIDTKLSVRLKENGAESIITGIYNPINGQRYYYDTEQLHHASNTVSDLLYQGVIGNEAYTSWKGNIIVNPGTVGTNGYQANKNLVIDETAKVESIPGLEIITDDVRCSHGVTIGNIDRNHMFYLQSRGINKIEAEKLIINGFLSAAKKRIKNQEFKNIVSSYFSK